MKKKICRLHRCSCGRKEADAYWVSTRLLGTAFLCFVSRDQHRYSLKFSIICSVSWMTQLRLREVKHLLQVHAAVIEPRFEQRSVWRWHLCSFCHSFIHWTNIFWVPASYPALFEVPKITDDEDKQGSRFRRPYILGTLGYKENWRPVIDWNGTNQVALNPKGQGLVHLCAKVLSSLPFSID